MKQAEILELATHGTYQGEPVKGKIEETHISWVLLSRRHAFKIKKPIKLSFLDFSNLALRQQFCKRELQLNSRFSDIYLKVVPISKKENQWLVDSDEGTVVDYAVLMKRMDTSKRMDKYLHNNNVDEGRIQLLAKKVAQFHQEADVIDTPFGMSEARNTFNDIAFSKKYITTHLGLSFGALIDDSIQWSNKKLAVYESRMQQRIVKGFKRDVHGDLHTGNVFLYRHPVIFDCIEFGDSYRQIDVLYEIAFLCMDLESHGKKRLADAFLKAYTKLLPCIENDDDRAIFNYFKCLRANVRAKVHAVAAQQADEPTSRKLNLAKTRKYLNLMRKYIDQVPAD
ncbi:MAG: phosphotransferase [Imperialibacter sp.]